MPIIIRNTLKSDVIGITELCKSVYPDSPPWSKEQIISHLDIFPSGQWIAEDTSTKNVVGMMSTLIIYWDDYNFDGSWKDFTDNGFFRNHDPIKGRTLYGAEVAVDPRYQGKGVGKLLYAERKKLVQKLKLLRIRAGARLRGYSRFEKTLGPEEYTIQVVKGNITDPTLSFQLKQGFKVLSVVSNYLRYDPESLGNAAVIEWINPEIAVPEDYLKGDQRFNL